MSKLLDAKADQVIAAVKAVVGRAAEALGKRIEDVEAKVNAIPAPVSEAELDVAVTRSVAEFAAHLAKRFDEEHSCG
jgi:phage shock protein A